MRLDIWLHWWEASALYTCASGWKPEKKTEKEPILFLAASGDWLLCLDFSYPSESVHLHLCTVPSWRSLCSRLLLPFTAVACSNVVKRPEKKHHFLNSIHWSCIGQLLTCSWMFLFTASLNPDIENLAVASLLLEYGFSLLASQKYKRCWLMNLSIRLSREGGGWKGSKEWERGKGKPFLPSSSPSHPLLLPTKGLKLRLLTDYSSFHWWQLKTNITTSNIEIFNFQ